MVPNARYPEVLVRLLANHSQAACPAKTARVVAVRVAALLDVCRPILDMIVERVVLFHCTPINTERNASA